MLNVLHAHVNVSCGREIQKFLKFDEQDADANDSKCIDD